MSTTILHGNCRTVLPTLPSGSVQCVVTSPPYWKLRDYGVGAASGEIGQEPTLAAYVAVMVELFRDVRRVLVDDGTCWLNLGDGYKNKQLMGMPWRVAFALQDDGWILRSDVIWNKPNAMPDGATDRPTKSHEYLFLFAKKERYRFNADAIAEYAVKGDANAGARNYRPGTENNQRKYEGQSDKERTTRNRRSVWSISTRAEKSAHFAVMPEALVEPCILAGSRPGDTVLDPFGGSGTVGRVAERLQRKAVLIELNPNYIDIAERRTDGVQLEAFV